MKYVLAAVMYACFTGAAVCIIVLIGFVNIDLFNWILSTLDWLFIHGRIFLVPFGIFVALIAFGKGSKHN